jgi:uncharacterized membrane protein
VAEPERDRGFERLVAFVDAMVAIAITLLVLPLVELTSEVDDYASVGALLRENQSQVWAFLLSFAVIARLWFVQHDGARAPGTARVGGWDVDEPRLLGLTHRG